MQGIKRRTVSFILKYFEKWTKKKLKMKSRIINLIEYTKVYNGSTFCLYTQPGSELHDLNTNSFKNISPSNYQPNKKIF